MNDSITEKVKVPKHIKKFVKKEFGDQPFRFSHVAAIYALVEFSWLKQDPIPLASRTEEVSVILQLEEQNHLNFEKIVRALEHMFQFTLVFYINSMRWGKKKVKISTCIRKFLKQYGIEEDEYSYDTAYRLRGRRDMALRLAAAKAPPGPDEDEEEY